MPIRIQVVTDRYNPISFGIRLGTGGEFSHAEFIDTEKHVTFGARFIGGVKFRPCDKDHYSKVEQFTAKGIELAYEWALTQEGKPYDLGAVAAIKLSTIGIKIRRNWRDPGKWYCSELVARAFEMAGVPKGQWASATPENIPGYGMYALLSTRPSAAFYFITPRDLPLSRSLDYFAVNA